jgi:hypothetical protein
MQVSMPSLQHEVMIEAVENHNPEAIVIDEIGRELEAAAARTIAERGVQLIGTAHGNTLDNLLLNPTLSDLVGGIESVTLSDEEARRRGTQKTVLERRSPPTFDVLIEIQHRDRLAVHKEVGTSVDAMLRGYPLPPEIRSRDDSGNIHVEQAPAQANAFQTFQGGSRQGHRRQAPGAEQERVLAGPEESANQSARFASGVSSGQPSKPLELVRIYPYGVARNRLAQAAKRMAVPVLVVSEPNQADVLVTLRSYYRKRQRTIVDAEHRNMPIFVLRSNTVNQMQQFMSDLFNLTAEYSGGKFDEAYVRETQEAIEAVLNGERWVELHPATAAIRRMEHQMAREANLVSHSYGKEPRRRVRIFREGF